jgi:predicted nucleic acid-binding protein
MYAAGGDHPNKEACVWVMEEVTEGRLAVAINTETIQEILYRYGALQRWNVAITMVTNLLNIVPTVYPVLLADARLAVDLFRQYGSQGMRSRDLFHAAVMQNNGLSTIVSTDAHFDRIPSITRLDPQSLFRQAQQP